MTDDEYMQWLKDECCYAVVVPTGKGKWVGLQRLAFHWTMHEGRLHDMIGHDRRFCYATFDIAADALAEWAAREFEDEPERWHRDPYTGRRRPEGDKEREYVAD